MAITAGAAVWAYANSQWTHEDSHGVTTTGNSCEIL